MDFEEVGKLLLQVVNALVDFFVRSTKCLGHLILSKVIVLKMAGENYGCSFLRRHLSAEVHASLFRLFKDLQRQFLQLLGQRKLGAMLFYFLFCFSKNSVHILAVSLGFLRKFTSSVAALDLLAEREFGFGA